MCRRYTLCESVCVATWSLDLSNRLVWRRICSWWPKLLFKCLIAFFHPFSEKDREKQDEVNYLFLSRYLGFLVCITQCFENEFKKAFLRDTSQKQEDLMHHNDISVLSVLSFFTLFLPFCFLSHISFFCVSSIRSKRSLSPVYEYSGNCFLTFTFTDECCEALMS